jgi:glutamate-5-semialdehyde dehydrogenase
MRWLWLSLWALPQLWAAETAAPTPEPEGQGSWVIQACWAGTPGGKVHLVTQPSQQAIPLQAQAGAIIANAKMRRTGVCGATETLLIDAAIAPALLPALIADLRALGCDFRADDAARAIVPGLTAATDEDYATEWLDAILSVKVVSGVAEALTHIRRFGSEHTEAIITEDAAAAQQFLDGIASAVGLWNASTQFCDGSEFGFGAEIGIATGRLHARGPVGLEQLCTYRYKIFGTGQVRP